MSLTTRGRPLRISEGEKREILSRYEHVELKRYASQRRLAYFRDNAPYSLECHARLVHRTDRGVPMMPAPHHQEWIPVLENRRDFPYLAIIAPPGYAKSSWVTGAYVSWRLGASGGTTRIILCSNTATQAMDFAQGVQAAVTHPWFQKAYPGVEPDYGRGWTKDRFWLTPNPDSVNPSLLAVGINGPVVGKRADEIVLDDPTTFQEASSRVIMAKQQNWLKNTLIRRFPAGMQPPHGRGGRMVVVATRWGENDLIPTLESLGFKVLNFPALGYWDRVARCPDCGEERDRDWVSLLRRCEHCDSGERPVMEWGRLPLWPEADSYEALAEEERDDPLLFQLIRQGDASAFSGQMFQGPFQHGEPPQDETIEGTWHERVRAAFDRVVQYVDTSGGEKQNMGDFFALCTLGVRDGGNEVWVLDMERGRFQAPEQERVVQTEADEWDPDLIVIEEVNEGRALYQRLVRVARNLPLRKKPPTRSKEFRAIGLVNAYKAGIVWHPSRARWLRSYEAELVAFPKGTYDDQVDAAAGAFNASSDPGPRLRALIAR